MHEQVMQSMRIL